MSRAGEDRRRRPLDRGFHRRCGQAALRIPDSRSNAFRAARRAIDADHKRRPAHRPLRGFLWGVTDLNLVIERLQAYAEAGADCLYRPASRPKEQIAAVVKASVPKPVNLLIGGPACRERSRRSRRPPHQRRRLIWRARPGAAS